MINHSRDRPIVKAVLDTGPLFNALVLHLVEKSPESRRKGILEQSAVSSYLVSSTIRQEAFLQLFRSIPTILTTAHVIAEVNGLIKKGQVKGERHRAFWTHGMELLSARALDERLSCRLLDMFIDGALKESICTIGPVDTALIELARGEGCSLLTDDKTIGWRAWEIGVDCRLVYNLIESNRDID
jgi:rRNA-processing protein FCF1